MKTPKRLFPGVLRNDRRGFDRFVSRVKARKGVTRSAATAVAVGITEEYFHNLTVRRSEDSDEEEKGRQERLLTKVREHMR